MIDVVGAICTRRHSGTGVATVAIDNLSFKAPAEINSITTELIGSNMRSSCEGGSLSARHWLCEPRGWLSIVRASGSQKARFASPLIGHISDVYIGDELVKLVSYSGGDFYYGSSTRATFKTIGSSTSLSGAVPDGISDIKSMVSYLSDRFETVGSGDGKTFKLNGIPYCYTTFSNCDTITPLDNKIVCTTFLDGSNLTTGNGWIVINDEQADIVSSNVNLYNDSTNQSILFSNYVPSNDNYKWKFLGYKNVADDYGYENIMFVKELKNIKRSTTDNYSFSIPSDFVLINNTELSYFQNSETFDCVYDSQDVA